MKPIFSLRDKNEEEGFTLIELLVVILIIGILSAIATPAFLSQRKAAVDATIKSDVVNAAKQVASWDVGNGGQAKPFPTSITGTPLENVVSSTGNTLTLRGNSSEYCILGINPSGSNPTAGIAYSSKNSGIKENFDCGSTFTPSENPSMDADIVFNEITNEEPPLVNPPAICDDVSFTGSTGTTITCTPGTNNWSQDVFVVTVKSTSDTPVEWNVAVNAARSKGYVRTTLDSSNAFDNYTVNTPTFNIVGTDRSWNANPAAANNYKFIDKTKTMTFTVRVAWR